MNRLRGLALALLLLRAAPSAAQPTTLNVTNIATPETEDVFGRRYTLSLVKGDANGDGVVGVAGVFFLINFLFAGGPAPL